MKKTISKKFIITFIITLCALLTVSCADVTDMPVELCSSEYPGINAGHPKAEALQQVLDRYTRRGIPGIILLVKDPVNGMWIGTSGVSRIEDRQPIQGCSLVYPCSIAKTIFAVEALKLAEEGRINLDANISEYLPRSLVRKIPNGSKVTVRQLMNHTSGIPDPDMNYTLDIMNDMEYEYPDTIDDRFEYLSTMEALSSPGKKFSYADINYEILTRIIDNTAGMGHEEYLQETIIGPLGLSNTCYRGGINTVARRIVNCYFDFTGNRLLENISRFLLRHTRQLAGADGFVTDLYDLNLFISALYDGQLLGDESFAEMNEFVDTDTDGEYEYGLGLLKKKTHDRYIYGHGGSNPGAGAMMYYDPETKTVMVTAINGGTFFPGWMQDRFEGYWDEVENVMLGE